MTQSTTKGASSSAAGALGVSKLSIGTPPTTNRALNLGGSSGATYFGIQETSTDGRYYLIGATGTPNGQGAGKLVFFDLTSGTQCFAVHSTGNIAIGAGVDYTMPAPARVTARSTTEPLRLEYDATNYASFTVSSAGVLTISATGGIASLGTKTTSGRVVLANGASTTVTHAADASNLRRAKFYEYVVTGTSDNPVQFQADFNGTNGATSYTDQSVYMRTITFSGSAALNTSIKKYGTASLSLPSSGGGYITIPNACFNVGTGNFCIEFWMYLTALPGSTGYVIDTRSGGADSAVSPLIYINSSGSVKWHTNNIDRISSANLSATTWYHISFCRNSGTLTMYVDGVSAGTWADSTNYSIAGTGLIGKSSGSPLYLNGYLDDLVIRHDAYRTGAFTPPAAGVSPPTYTVTLKPRAESVVTILHDNGAGANRSTQTTATNASGGTLQGELIVIQ